MANISFPKTDLIMCKFFVPGSTETLQAKQYIFKCVPGLRPRVGDLVAVHCSTGYQVAYVDLLDATVPKGVTPTAYAISHVCIDDYTEFLKQQARMAATKIALENRYKELEALLAYEIMAARDPRFKELLESFKAMGGTI